MGGRGGDKGQTVGWKSREADKYLEGNVGYFLKLEMAKEMVENCQRRGDRMSYKRGGGGGGERKRAA